MMRRTRPIGPAVLAALAAAAISAAAQSGPAAGGVTPEIRAKAAGIFAALDKIEAEARRPGPSRAFKTPPAPKPGARSLAFTEAELNAYAACLLEDRGEPFIKAIELKLLAGDRIEGRISLDLGKPQASGLMAQKQELLFTAGVETKDGRIRITMDKLFLGTQPISPAFVDVVIGVVSRLQGVEPTSLKDWYDLPPGVLRLESRPGQVVVIY
jgi:hypothetical protein